MNKNEERHLKIIELARRNARGECTPVQLNWLCNKLNTTEEEINKIYADFLNIESKFIFYAFCLIVLSLFFIAFIINGISILCFSN